ncbi:hypothetical protein EJ07DRAFT_158089 [Lizonia empirigonia]|nr:hypothetical protein EJ07DRAFT_158089 [Lizonia empirigonia]
MPAPQMVNGGRSLQDCQDQSFTTPPSSTSPPSSTCSYHAPILALQLIRSATSDSTPMTRFANGSSSSVPFGMLYNARVGTAASSGCTCVQASQQETDPMALEIEAIRTSGRDVASSSTSQP